MRTQAEKGRLFRELHTRPGILLLPNPWDAGTARILESVGFDAMATTSLGLANALGRVDGSGAVTRAELLENCRVIAAATSLPVAADLENGYADDPADAATIIRDASAAGIAGGSIEDASWDPAKPIYDFNHAVERVRAAVEMARSLPVPFMLTARAENLIRGRPDIDDTIKRLRAFAAAGADVLYAPGLPDLASMKHGGVVRGLQAAERRHERRRPGAHGGGPGEAVGVKRISVGGALSRLALAAFIEGARQMKEGGSFAWVRDTVPTRDLKPIFGG